MQSCMFFNNRNLSASAYKNHIAVYFLTRATHYDFIFGLRRMIPNFCEYAKHRNFYRHGHIKLLGLSNRN